MRTDNLATRTAPLRQALLDSRHRTDELFRLVRPESLYERPVPERHRMVFYLGHLEAFDWNQIGAGALGMTGVQPDLDRLFAFGIDPPQGQLPADQASDWPSLKEIYAYNRRVREKLDLVLDEAPEEILQVAIEHRLMHAETFSYILHNLSPERKQLPLAQPPREGPAPVHRMIEIPPGVVTLGRERDAGFGWDNEFAAHTVGVPSFAISKYKVTNAQYLEFVRTGAAAPHLWIEDRGEWRIRTMFGEIPLPLQWPAYVTHTEAQAYAQWLGKSLPSEAQFHRAAYGTLNGEESLYPWGNTPPHESRGNFDFARWDPIPVSASPAGDSAFGVSQLVGNGWEWTSTVFHPFTGFEPFSFYPGYSAQFFGGGHFVLKGGSARTAACLLRRSFRNWFRPDYRYAYAGFRCVE
ncbi:MAG TPA: SUMF1/EgtB/PvdO family nonheme iron enzyme [Nitrospirales bacterium]